MIADRILACYDPPPTPTHKFDYCAIFDSYGGEPSDPVGYGPTKYAAILDLLAEAEWCAENAPLADWVC